MAAARQSQAAVLRADTRRLVLEAAERGCRVKVEPDGTVHIDPPSVGVPEVTTADLINWQRPTRHG